MATSLWLLNESKRILEFLLHRLAAQHPAGRQSNAPRAAIAPGLNPCWSCVWINVRSSNVICLYCFVMQHSFMKMLHLVFERALQCDISHEICANSFGNALTLLQNGDIADGIIEYLSHSLRWHSSCAIIRYGKSSALLSSSTVTHFEFWGAGTLILPN